MYSFEATHTKHKGPQRVLLQKIRGIGKPKHGKRRMTSDFGAAIPNSEEVKPE
jgi:hypothetical protein